MESIGFKFGPQVIASYKRLSYTPWHALAEYIDNSTQSFTNHEDDLTKIMSDKKERLYVRIAYDKDDGGLLRIVDNASGMSRDDLECALEVSRPPVNSSGRSKYGLGMKTASCWLGNKWSIRTKKYGEDVEHSVVIDVDAISKGNTELPYTAMKVSDVTTHYTIIEITKMNHQFHGRTLGKIKEFLRSMYRLDLSSGRLLLEFRGDTLSWDSLESKLLKLPDGSRYRKDFSFKIGDRPVTGWVGILAKGSRRDAGFSILQCGRVIKGWPESYRPTSIYGQLQGSNDLVNQRLVGEIHLDGFLVSHTKDEIIWQGPEEEDLESELEKACHEYKVFALKRRSTRDDERGPSDADLALAIDEIRRELESPEMVDQIKLSPIPPIEIIQASKEKITEQSEKIEATFTAVIDGLNVLVYIRDDMSPNDAYAYIEAANDDPLMIIVNKNHPYWSQLGNSQDALNYLRHCIYDGLAEWKAIKKASRIDPDTIRILKDGYLRIPMQIENHQDDAAGVATD